MCAFYEEWCYNFTISFIMKVEMDPEFKSGKNFSQRSTHLDLGTSTSKKKSGPGPYFCACELKIHTVAQFNTGN